MKRYLAESHIEEAAIEWLKQIKPYHYKHGEDIHRRLNKAVLENLFAAFLQNKYPHVPAKVLAEVHQEFLFNSGSDIHTRNHEFHKKLSKGISKTWLHPSNSPQGENNVHSPQTGGQTKTSGEERISKGGVPQF